MADNPSLWPLIDYTAADGGCNIDIIPLVGGGVDVRIFAAGKATTTRSVVLPPEEVLALQLALASHLHTERTNCDAQAVQGL